MLDKFKKNIRKFGDSHGGSWFYFNAVSHHMDLIKEYKRIFSKYIKKNSKVLDLGAGRLFYRDIIKQYSKNYKSIDFTKTHNDLDHIGTASNTNLKSNEFDVIFCSQVLEHVPDPNESFEEINRILKKDGIAIISVPFLMYLHNEPYDFFRYTKHALRKFSKENNFKIIELKEVGGLFGFFGAISSMLLIGSTWNIPIINWIFYGINFIIQNIFYFLDMITFNSKIFPSNYLLMVKKK